MKRKLESGRHDNASEVIREPLRTVLKLEAHNEWLKREATIGYAQLDAGETVQVMTRKQFLALVREDK